VSSQTRTRTRPAASLAARTVVVAARLNLPLVAIVVGGFAFSAYFTSRMTEWLVMTDELQHVKLGVSIAQTLNPLPIIRGAPSGAYAQLYPLLTAPLYGLLDMPTAFRAVHVLNSLIMASTAIPAYLLTREVSRWRPAAWIVAALTVVVPWMSLGTMLMTEVAAYPAFVWAVLAMYRTIVKPSPRRDLLALAALLVAFLARTQFIVLALALPVALLAHEIGFSQLACKEQPWRNRLTAGLSRAVRGHLVLAVTAVVGAVSGAVVFAAGKSSLIFGSYAATTRGDLTPPGTGRYALNLLALAGVGIGIVPVVLAVGWAVSAALRPTDRRGHAFAVLFIVVSTMQLVQVASFLVRFSPEIQDRYVFYLVPLAFVAMAACLQDARRRWGGISLAGAAFAWVTTLVLFTPGQRSFFASPPSGFDKVIEGQTQRIGHLIGNDNLTPRTAIVVGTLIATAALAFAVRRLPPRLLTVGVSLLVFAFCSAETAYVTNAAVAPNSKRDVTRLNWVDRLVPADSYAAMIPGTVNEGIDGVPQFLSSYTIAGYWWSVELWNKSVQRSFRYEGAQYAGNTPFDLKEMTVENTTGAVEADLHTPYLVVSHSDVYMRVRGQSLGVDPATGLELLRAPLPARADWESNLPDDGWTPAGEPVRIRLFSGPGIAGRERRVTATLGSIQEITSARPYEFFSGGRTNRGTVEPASYREVAFDVCMGPGPHTDVKLRVKGAQELHSVAHRGSAGLRVSKISVAPLHRSCTRRQ
jgi:hypothetical protein